MLERLLLPIGITNPEHSNLNEPYGLLLWLYTTSVAEIGRTDHIVCRPTSPAPKVSLQIWTGFRLKRRSVLIPRMVASHHWPFDQAYEPNIRTCGSSRTEQDYHSNDTVNSRVKLTCLTTV